MAYGAPDPADPSGALNDFLYVGTEAGHLFVTFSGGGANGNQWKNLSAGLDGSAVQSIITNPNRGSHEAYAVTLNGVYHMVDSTVANATWQNITGALLSIQHNLFTPFNDATQFSGTQPAYLTSIKADWRYAIPDNASEFSQPANPPGPVHPVLYVGGEGGVGSVHRVERRVEHDDLEAGVAGLLDRRNDRVADSGAEIYVRILGRRSDSDQSDQTDLRRDQ